MELVYLGQPVLLIPACPTCSSQGHFCNCFSNTLGESFVGELPPEQEEGIDEEEKECELLIPETGGCNSINRSDAYIQLKILDECQWTQFEESLYCRCTELELLNVCWILDANENARAFGIPGDWIKISDLISWQCGSFVVVNVNEKTTTILEQGRNPRSKDLKQGLRYMRDHASVGILAKMDKEENIEWSQLEVCWDPNKFVERRAFVRDKILIAVLQLNRRVQFWRY